MKLVPTMFYDPEPKPDDFNKVCGFPCKCRDCADVPDSKCGYKLHEEAHNEWKRRQMRPDGFFSDSMTEYYNAHRLRFEGFEKTEETDTIELTDGRLTITFEIGGSGIHLYAISPQGKCIFNLYYADGLSLQLFKDTCQEKGINLQEM